MPKKTNSFAGSVGEALNKGLWFYLGWKLASADVEDFQIFMEIFDKHNHKQSLEREDIVSIKSDFAQNDIIISDDGVELLFDEFKKIDGN